jgi:hypothetical protein
LPDPLVRSEVRGFKSVEEGFFSSENDGGRLPQVYISFQRTGPTLSYSILSLDNIAMILMVLAGDRPERDAAQAKRALDQAEINEVVLSYDSIKVICSKPHARTVGDLEIYYPTLVEQLSSAGVSLWPLYAPSNLFSRFHPFTRFVILRADFFTFGTAKTYSELLECIDYLKYRLQD